MQEEAEEKKNELLSAFNVATFKNDEDDATFWSRLIPEEQRAKVPDRKHRKGSNPDAEPSARTARRNNAAASEAKGEAPCVLLACHASRSMLWLNLMYKCTSQVVEIDRAGAF